MNAFGFLRNLNEVCKFQTREGKKVGAASTSEMKRWIQNGALEINGERLHGMKNLTSLSFPWFCSRRTA